MTQTPTTLKHTGQHQATDAADFRVVALIDATIARHAASGQRFSANTLRDELPTVTSRGLIGARLDAARKRGELVAVDRERSTLLSTRSAWICVWIGVNSRTH